MQEGAIALLEGDGERGETVELLDQLRVLLLDRVALVQVGADRVGPGHRVVTGG